MNIAHETSTILLARWELRLSEVAQMSLLEDLKGQCPDYAQTRASSVFSSKDNRTHFSHTDSTRFPSGLKSLHVPIDIIKK